VVLCLSTGAPDGAALRAAARRLAPALRHCWVSWAGPWAGEDLAHAAERRLSRAPAFARALAALAPAPPEEAAPEEAAPEEAAPEDAAARGRRAAATLCVALHSLAATLPPLECLGPRPAAEASAAQCWEGTAPRALFDMIDAVNEKGPTPHAPRRQSAALRACRADPPLPPSY
jgi:hypothetical protein